MRLLILLLCLHAASALAAPRVVASIVPLQELAAAVMNGLGDPEVIIDRQASAHHFAFRPSHLRRLERADLFAWIDRDFESGFNRIDDILPPGCERLELLPALGIRHGDGHIWYSPTRLQQSARLIVEKLASLDPVNRPVYEENAAMLTRQLYAWRESTRALLAQAPLAIVTEHDFLGHFAREFELERVYPIHDRHDAQGSLHDLEWIETRLRQAPAKCLLTADGNVSALARRLAEKYGLSIVDVDARSTPSTSGLAIVQRLERLGHALDACR